MAGYSLCCYGVMKKIIIRYVPRSQADSAVIFNLDGIQHEIRELAYLPEFIYVRIAIHDKPSQSHIGKSTPKHVSEDPCVAVLIKIVAADAVRNNILKNLGIAVQGLIGPAFYESSI